MEFVKTFLREEQGQTVTEYAILLGLLALVALAAIILAGNYLLAFWEWLAGQMDALPG